MHIVNTVMVIAVTFFCCAMVMTMVIVIVVRPGDEQRFDPSSSAIVTFIRRNALRRLIHKGFHFGPIHTTKSAFCKRFTSEGRRNNHARRRHRAAAPGSRSPHRRWPPQKPSGFIEVTTAALASGTCANKTAPSPAQRSVFLCNIMRLVIEISECDVIL